MAKDYGIAPWQVEDECSQDWLARWSEYRTAETEEQERLRQNAEKEAKRRSHGR